VIEIQPPADATSLSRAVAMVDQYHWIVFVSANGVRYFLAELFAQQHDARHLHGVKLAAVGPGTAAELSQNGLRADLIPGTCHAAALATALEERVAGQRVLLIRANRGHDVLRQRLSRTAAQVVQVEAYASVDASQADPHVRSLLEDGKIDWLLAMSSASARSLINLFGESLRRTRIASLSPLTSATLRECGWEPAVEATPHTGAGLIAAICAAVQRTPGRGTGC
jgi:uroporphyrinogen III methyltransferase/synthase